MAAPSGISEINHQWRIVSRPEGRVKPSDFEWREEPLSAVGEGQILVRIVYLSIDPTNRAWMNPFDTYLPMLPLGATMRGITVGVVEASRHSDFSPGDIVQGLGGWQEYFAGDPSGWSKLPRIPDLPVSAYLGAMGHIGFTAYFGLTEIGRPKPGETLVVSAAAGAVGSIAGQIGKILGCRVVGIAGSDDKCHWITEDLGFDAAINYRKEDVRGALDRVCKNGIDIDFENVGGDIMDAVFGQLNLFARVIVCGLISQYNATAPVPGPTNFANILVKRARVQGFIVTDYASRFPEAAAQIVQWLKQGRLRYRLDVVEGLEHAPAALNRLFDGTNTGKLLVKVSEEPA
jgi:NADPH-dependent curcumin reductase CurA